MRQEMSFVSLILFIAIGLLVFAIVFLFAKRQIARFTLRSARSPHAAIGSDAPKPMRAEIERRLRRTREIRSEPTLMSAKYEAAFLAGPHKENLFLYRMKALDSFKQFDVAMRSENGPARRPDQNIRQYLLSLVDGHIKASTTVVQEFADAYDHARHDPADFKEKEYLNYMRLLNQILDATRTKQQLSRHNSTASSASTTSQTSQTALISDEVYCRQRSHQSMTILPEETSV